MTKLTTRPSRSEEYPFHAKRELSVNFPADAPLSSLPAPFPRPIDAMDGKRAFALCVGFFHVLSLSLFLYMHLIKNSERLNVRCDLMFLTPSNASLAPSRNDFYSH